MPIKTINSLVGLRHQRPPIFLFALSRIEQFVAGGSFVLEFLLIVLFLLFLQLLAFVLSEEQQKLLYLLVLGAEVAIYENEDGNVEAIYQDDVQINEKDLLE